MVIYVLCEHDYDYSAVKFVLDGPAGLDVDKLKNQFYKQFEVSGPHYPPYKGRTVPFAGYGCCASGSISIGEKIPDEKDPALKKWEARCNKIREQWSSKREENRKRLLKQLGKKYGGKDEWSCFLGMLKKDYKCKEVAFSESSI